jgi:hypothetical protein
MNTLLDDRVGPRSKNLSNLVPTRLDLRLLAVARRLRCYRAHRGNAMPHSNPTIAAAYHKDRVSRVAGGGRVGDPCRRQVRGTVSPVKLMTNSRNIKVP